MAIGKRIKFFRNRKGLKQKQLGEMLGFRGKTSDVRMAQYEAEARVPKNDLVNEMADILDVSPHAITVPDIDTYIGLMHTFFALEDMYGLKISEIDGEICLRLDKSMEASHASIFDMFYAWQQAAAKLETNEITREEYDQWRYNYPKFDTVNRWAHLPSEDLSDYLLKELKKQSNKKK